MRAFENAEAIIFDLDGTLYEGTEHYDYFARVLSNYIQEEKARKQYLDEYHEMTAWKHPLAIGKVLDRKRQVILTIDPMTNEIERVTEWTGEEWPVSAVLKTYGKSIAVDREKFAFVGDGWLLPILAGARHGIHAKYMQPSYQKVKEDMVGKDFLLKQTPGLKEGLRQLKTEGRKLILMTNSEADDVSRLLKKLDLDDVFHERLTMARKPYQTESNLQAIMERFNLEPGRVVSVGDNFLNEIAPALRLGMKGVYISPVANSPYTYSGLTVVTTLARQF